MTWRTLTCYDSRAVTVQSFSSAVGLLLHGLAGPFATGARGQESGGGVEEESLGASQCITACMAFLWLLHFCKQ